jgi:hypothetical protein
MQVKKNVVAAIATAINLYMMQAEEQPAIPAMEAPKALEMPRQLYSAWAMAGRQAAMETRRMWQMRLVR